MSPHEDLTNALSRLTNLHRCVCVHLVMPGWLLLTVREHLKPGEVAHATAVFTLICTLCVQADQAAAGAAARVDGDAG